MNIYNDPNDPQKRFEGKMAGSKGMGYAEVFPNKKLQELIGKLKSYLVSLSPKTRKRTDGV